MAIKKPRAKAKAKRTTRASAKRGSVKRKTPAKSRRAKR